MIKKPNKNVLNHFLPILSVVAIIIVWYLSAIAVGKQIIIPSPSSVVINLGRLLKSSEFYKAIGNSLIRTFESYAIALILALGFAILSAISKVFERLLSPFVVIARAVPTMSVILLALIWLSSANAPIFVAFLVIFPLLYTGSLDSIKRVNGNLIRMSKIYKVKKWDIVTKLYVRETLPSMFTLVRSTLSFNLKLIIAAEVLAQTTMSMGVFMYRQSAYMDTAALIAWTVAAVLLGYILEIIVRVIQKVAIRWDV